MAWCRLSRCLLSALPMRVGSPLTTGPGLLMPDEPGCPGAVGRPARQAHGQHPHQHVCLTASSSAAGSGFRAAAIVTSRSRPEDRASPTAAPARRPCWTTAGASRSSLSALAPPSRPPAALSPTSRSTSRSASHPAASPAAPACRPAAGRRPRGRARLCQGPGLPGGPAGRPGVDAGGDGRRAWRRAQHSAAPAGAAPGAAGGADPAATRRARARPGTPGAGTPRPTAAPGAPEGAGLCRGRGVPAGSPCGAGLVGAATVRPARRRSWLARPAAGPARTTILAADSVGRRGVRVGGASPTLSGRSVEDGADDVRPKRRPAGRVRRSGASERITALQWDVRPSMARGANPACRRPLGSSLPRRLRYRLHLCGSS
jgi:hypothetical protein